MVNVSTKQELKKQTQIIKRQNICSPRKNQTATSSFPPLQTADSLYIYLCKSCFTEAPQVEEVNLHQVANNL